MTTSSEPFVPDLAARGVLRTAFTGALATLRPDGMPFASLVTVATQPDGAPLMLLSRLAVHTRNLEADGRASLLLVAPGGEAGDPLAGARLTLVGRVAPLGRDPAARARFLAAHPEAGGYVEFGDFGFYRLDIASGHLVAGFGRIVELAPSELLVDAEACAAAIEAEADILAHMNADHADALALYATRPLGQPAGGWRAVAADPDGLDLRAGDRRARLAYGERARTPGDVRRLLKDLAARARGL